MHATGGGVDEGTPCCRCKAFGRVPGPHWPRKLCWRAAADPRAGRGPSTHGAAPALGAWAGCGGQGCWCLRKANMCLDTATPSPFGPCPGSPGLLARLCCGRRPWAPRGSAGGRRRRCSWGRRATGSWGAAPTSTCWPGTRGTRSQQGTSRPAPCASGRASPAAGCPLAGWCWTASVG